LYFINISFNFIKTAFNQGKNLRNKSAASFLALFSATLFIFSFPPFNLSFLAWVAFIPLFFLLEELTRREVFLFYFLSGLIFWLFHIWWITYITYLGYSLLVIYLGFFFGFFGLLLKYLREKTRYPLIFLAPSIWILFEFIRTYLFTGFPWSLLGYSQWRNIPLIQISSITGVYGVSFLIVMINAAVYDFAFSKTKKHLRNLILSILIIIVIVAFGKIIPSKEEDSSDKIKISVIQGSIPQDIKWNKECLEDIVNTYAELSIYAGKDNDLSLIIWPETSYPDYVDVDSELFGKIKHLTSYTNIPILIGGITQKNSKDYNSAFLISPDGKIRQTYNKLHLVPFAEYIPLEKFFFFLRNTIPQIGSFKKGSKYTVFKIKNQKLKIKNRFGVLICFEDLFPDLSRRFTNKGANFLVNITNDAHFHQSPALWQHFTHSVFRAVENRRPVVRAANNGISGFIDQYGRIVQILNDNGKAIGVRGFLTSRVKLSSAKTIYTQFGDVFSYLNILYLAILLMLTRKNIKEVKNDIQEKRK
jgi:apolipoprotein N-acyltransferase